MRAAAELPEPPACADEAIVLGPLEPDGSRPFTYDYDQDRCSQYDATIRLTGVIAPDGTIRGLKLAHRGEAVVWRSPL